MPSHWGFVIVAVLLTASAQAVAIDIPRSFSATYVGRPYGIGKLEAVITLERSGDHLKYTMQSNVSAPLYRNEFYECSVMALRGDRIYPLEYKHTDKNNPAKNLTGRFDWNANTATVTRVDKEKRITGLVWPVWDPLSLQVGIMTDLLNGKFGAEKTYRLLDRAGVKEKRLRNAGEERMDVDKMQLTATRIERQDGKAERLWFAEERDYMPVRIELKNVDVQLATPPRQIPSPSAAPTQVAPRC